MEIYATSPTGNVEEISYNKTTGWKGWQNLGRSLTGTPFAIYDTNSASFELYATGTDGTLDEAFYNVGTGTWSAVFSHGGSIVTP